MPQGGLPVYERIMRRNGGGGKGFSACLIRLYTKRHNGVAANLHFCMYMSVRRKISVWKHAANGFIFTDYPVPPETIRPNPQLSVDFRNNTAEKTAPRFPADRCPLLPFMVKTQSDSGYQWTSATRDTVRLAHRIRPSGKTFSDGLYRYPVATPWLCLEVVWIFGFSPFPYMLESGFGIHKCLLIKKYRISNTDSRLRGNDGSRRNPSCRYVVSTIPKRSKTTKPPADTNR